MLPMQAQRRKAAGCPEPQLEAPTLQTTYSSLTHTLCMLTLHKAKAVQTIKSMPPQRHHSGIMQGFMWVSLWRACARIRWAASCSSAAIATAASSVSAASSDECTGS